MKKTGLCIQIPSFVMKVALLYSFLTLAFTVWSFAKEADGQEVLDKKITISIKEENFKSALQKISQEAGVKFSYTRNTIPEKEKVSLTTTDETLASIFYSLFQPYNIQFEVVGNQVILKKNGLLGLLAERDVAALETNYFIPVSGTVKDTEGNPVGNVSVVVKGTGKGTTTNANGEFTIDAKAGDELNFSIIGYKPISVIVGSSTNIMVTMEMDVSGLGEVVVVGYGTQKKVNLSGAVASVSGKELANRPITNINQGLEGLIANLNISPANGRATTAPDFNIRGFTSINGGSAFILVDNVPATPEEVARLNPADIASVSVLKDAASAAIYGARAAFGVVLITTKTAKSDKLIIAANANYAIRNIGSVPDLVTDPLQVMQYKHDAATPLYDLYPDAVRAYAEQRSKDPSLPAVIVDPTNPNAYAYYGSTNWMKEAYNNVAPAYTANVSIAKRDKKLSYFLSAGYYRQEGLLRYGNDILNRYNLRTNATYQLTDWLKVGTTSAYTYSTYSSPNFIDGLFFWDVNRTPSLSVPKNPDGTWTSDGAAILGVLQQGGRRTTSTNDILTTLNTEISLVKDVWAIKGDATFRRTNTPTQSYNLAVPYTLGPNQPVGYRFADGSGGNAYAQNEGAIANQNVFNIYTDFHKTFGTKHFLQALAGFNQEYRYWNDFTVRRNGLITNSLPTPQLATGTISQTNTIAEWAVRGLFYRLNYIYDDKYIVEFNGRKDGSSHFPPNDRWGFFPSASGAWVISKENFFQPIAKSLKLDMFKIRGSYGMLGNQVTSTDPRLNNYPYIPTMSSGQIGQILDGALPIAVYQPGVVSPTLTWEKVSTLNGGVDIALFNNKLELSYDRYTRHTDDMLTKSKTLPAVFGATEPKTNAANLKTNGWELTASYRDQFRVGNDPLHFTLRFTLADNKSFITKYDNPNKILSDYYVGQQIGEIWGLTTDGFFQDETDLQKSPDQTAVGSDDQQYKFYVGDLKFKDLNNDNKVDFGDNTVANPGDRKIIGNSSPRLPYSFDLSGDWKGFDLRIFLQGIGKRDWYPGNSNIYFWGVYAQPWTNVTVQNLDHWSPNNPNGYFPRLKAYIAEDQSELGAPQTRYLQDASYLRVKNITVGYSLPQSLMQKWNLGQIRFYISGENLFTFSHLKVNMDPEGLGEGIRGAIYPFQKTYSFGVNVNF